MAIAGHPVSLSQSYAKILKKYQVGRLGDLWTEQKDFALTKVALLVVVCAKQSLHLRSLKLALEELEGKPLSKSR